MYAGVVLEIGATEGWRCENELADMRADGLSAEGLAEDERRRWRRGASRGTASGDRGGVRSVLISLKLCAKFCVLSGILVSSRFIGGGTSSVGEEATMGAASASGDDMDEGVDDRVWRDLGCGKGTGAVAGIGDSIGDEELFRLLA